MSGITVRNPEDIERYARILSNPGSPQWKMLYAAEVGIGPASAQTAIQVVNGKPGLSANAWAGLIKRSGRYNFKVIEQTDEKCSLQFTDHGEPCGPPVSFTMDDAKRAGLTGSQTYRKYPSAMLFARALTKGARTYCADVAIGGIYTPDELEEAEPIEISEPDPAPQDALPPATDGEPGPDEAFVIRLKETMSDDPKINEAQGETGRLFIQAKGVASKMDLNEDQRAELIATLAEVAEQARKENTP